ncbi:MAG: helix-turn-helix domain-containing protein, partial [Coprococcus sp.]
FEELDLELVGMAYDGESLLQMILDQSPDIVITDISMPKLDGLEVIRQAYNAEKHCKFIVVSGYRHFEYAYNALKYKVEDYLLKPITEETLNTTLRKVKDTIKTQGRETEDEKGRELRRLQFISQQVLTDLVKNPKSVEDINRIFATRFESGRFRMILVKLDFEQESHQLDIDVSAVLKQVGNIMRLRLSEACNDMIFEYKSEGVLATVNYQLNSELELQESVQQIFLETASVTELFRGLKFTVCVSRAVDNPNKLIELCSSIQQVIWQRLFAGVERVIYDRERNLSVEYDFSELRNHFIKSFEIIDEELFLKCMDQFFSLPYEVLRNKSVTDFLAEVMGELIRLNKEPISTFTDVEAVLERYRQIVRLSYTEKGLKENVSELVLEVMHHIKEALDKKHVKPVRSACQYIEENYQLNIRLEEIAQHVNLSAAYFSYLFKKETGKSLSEYVTEIKLQKARDMLKQGDLNISEIACEIGYSDVRYFSKIFKRVVGVKPSEYRKIYG